MCRADRDIATHMAAGAHQPRSPGPLRLPQPLMNSSAVPTSKGFEGVIQGATLSDLIQMECLALTTRAVRVDRGASSGRIYFAGGQVVHAELGALQG